METELLSTYLKQKEDLDQKVKELEKQKEELGKIIIEHEYFEEKMDDMKLWNFDTDILTTTTIDEEKVVVEKVEKKRSVKNKIITAKTQVGKTEFILNFINNAPDKENIIFAISCDNNLSKLDQLKSRLVKKGMDFYVVKDVKKGAKKEINKIISSGKNCIFILLNNMFQIKKLKILIKDKKYKRFCVINDEGDTVNKSDDQSKYASQAAWKELFETIQTKPEILSIFRILVTATPENCYYLDDVKTDDTLVLPVPKNYSSVNKHVEWDGKNENIILDELNRMRRDKNKEFIIYCDESLNTDQSSKCLEFSKKFKCLALCYNGIGIQVNIDGKNATKLISNRDSISVCLQKLTSYADKYGMIVIGNRLMDRGISFVATGENPYTATSMFYSKGKAANAVSIAQRFGRITGTSNCVATTRTVFCNKKVYEDYKNYLGNQDMIYKSMINNKNKLVKDIIRTINGIKTLTRKVDRKELAITNKSYSDSCSEASSRSDNDTEKDSDKMKRLVASWMNYENKTAIAKLFRRMMMFNDGKMKEEDVKKLLKDCDITYLLNITNRKHINGWSLVFSKKLNEYYVKKEAVEYYKKIF